MKNYLQRAKDEFLRFLMIGVVISALVAGLVTLFGGIGAGLFALVVLLPATIVVALVKAAQQIV